MNEIELKRKLKAEYDKEYRLKNKEKMKLKKAEYHKRSYNPEKERIRRKLRYKERLEYLRTDKYREYKKQYDRIYRAKKLAGEYWESLILVLDIQSLYNDDEVRESNNLHNKTQKRKRQWKTKLNSQQLI